MINIFAVSPIKPPVNISGTPEVAFGKMMSGIIGIVLALASIFAFGQLLLGGIQYISSGGDKGLVETARNRIRDALVGLIVLFASWAIFLVILRILGLTGSGDSINLTLPKLF